MFDVFLERGVIESTSNKTSILGELASARSLRALDIEYCVCRISGVLSFSSIPNESSFRCECNITWRDPIAQITCKNLRSVVKIEGNCYFDTAFLEYGNDTKSRPKVYSNDRPILLVLFCPRKEGGQDTKHSEKSAGKKEKFQDIELLHFQSDSSLRVTLE